MPALPRGAWDSPPHPPPGPRLPPAPPLLPRISTRSEGQCSRVETRPGGVSVVMKAHLVHGQFDSVRDGKKEINTHIIQPGTGCPLRGAHPTTISRGRVCFGALSRDRERLGPKQNLQKRLSDAAPFRFSRTLALRGPGLTHRSIG